VIHLREAAYHFAASFCSGAGTHSFAANGEIDAKPKKLFFSSLDAAAQGQ
jgi:hypothetical protein